MIWALEAMTNGDMTGSKIDEKPRDEQRRYFAVAALVKGYRRVVCLVKIPDAGPDRYTSSFQVVLRSWMPAGIVQGFLSRCYRILRKQRHLTLLTGREPIFGLPFAIFAASQWNEAGDTAWEGLELSSSARRRHNTATAFEESTPCMLDACTQWRNCA